MKYTNVIKELDLADESFQELVDSNNNDNLEEEDLDDDFTDSDFDFKEPSLDDIHFGEDLFNFISNELLRVELDESFKSNDKLNNNPCNNYQEMLNGDMEEFSIDNLSEDIKEKPVKLFDSIPAGEITPEDLEDWD